MKKIISIVLAAVMLSLTACSNDNPGYAGSDDGPGELNILTWAGYVPDEVVAAFEEETGIKVNYATADDNESMFAKLQAANGGEYDILIVSDYIISAMIEEGGMLKALDKEKISNFDNIDPDMQGQFYDPEDKYTIPYAFACALLVYDTAAIDFEITSYEDLWNPALENSLVLLDGDRDIIGLTLQSLGYSLNETDPVRLEEAKEKMLALKPNVVAFDANSPHNAIISGDAKAGYMFGSQATEAVLAKDTVKFAFPEEGMGLYIDNVVMAANAPNEENAYTFLEYILEGENSAAISNATNYPNCNLAAKDYLSEEYLANEMVNMPASVLAKSESYADLGDARTLYSRIWVEFKSE